jgi:ABC-type transporter Mla MlaB component
MELDRPDDVMIAIEGPATIYEVTALREVLLQGLSKGGTLHIDLADSGKWDLAGLQLLISTLRTAQSQGRTAYLHRVTRICAEVAERSGLSDWLRSVSD